MKTILLTFFFTSLVFSIINPVIGLACLYFGLIVRISDRYPSLINIPFIKIIVVIIFVSFITNRNAFHNIELKQNRFFLYFLISIIFGLLLMAPSTLFDQLVDLIVLAIVYFYVASVINTNRSFKFFAWSILIFCTYLGIDGLYNYHLSNPVYFTNDRLNSVGFYSNPNEYGMILNYAVPFAYILFKTHRNKFIKIVPFIMTGFLALPLTLTLSRTAIVTFAFMLFLLAFAEKKKIIAFIIIGSMLAIAAPKISNTVISRIETIKDRGSDESYQGRKRAWSQGLRMAQWYPIFGVGKNQFLTHHGRAPHNSFVQVVAETGLIGFCFWMSLIYLSLKNLYLIRKACLKTDSELFFFVNGIGVNLIGFLLYSFFGNQGYNPLLFTLFSLSVAMNKLFKLELNAKAGN